MVVGALAIPATAEAHVTLNPSEWEAGGFARFAVRVPNERDNADTTRVTVQFPANVVSANFQPVEGWKRTVEMERLDEPIEEEGEDPITERLARVTWSGRIRPGEFQEFGVSFQVPEDAVGESLAFPSIQRYSNGEVVRWIGPEDADEPAPLVEVLPPAEEDDEAAATPAPEATPRPARANTEDDDGTGRANLALGVGIAGLVAGLGALGLTLVRRSG
jgi:periplasmic copper chaperone A